MYHFHPAKASKIRNKRKSEKIVGTLYVQESVLYHTHIPNS